jgi:hypothetical protein
MLGVIQFLAVEVILPIVTGIIGAYTFDWLTKGRGKGTPAERQPTSLGKLLRRRWWLFLIITVLAYAAVVTIIKRDAYRPKIDVPGTDQRVASFFPVVGRAQFDGQPSNVCVVVRTGPGAPWLAVDSVQINTDGRWRARGEVPAGTAVGSRVRVQALRLDEAACARCGQISSPQAIDSQRSSDVIEVEFFAATSNPNDPSVCRVQPGN